MIDKFGTKLNILLPILPSILIRFTDKKKPYKQTMIVCKLVLPSFLNNPRINSAAYPSAFAVFYQPFFRHAFANSPRFAPHILFCVTSPIIEIGFSGSEATKFGHHPS